MIDIVRLYETIAQRAKTGTSGYQSKDEFNRDIASVQTSLMGLLCPLYDSSQAVRDLLSPFVEPLALTTNATGVVAKPSDYFQMAALSISGFPVNLVAANERFMLQFVPSRRPSAGENRYFYYLESDNINVLPSDSAFSLVGTYIREPDEASIDFTVTSTDDDDYIEVTSVDDLEWPERAFNLFVCMMLQNLGLEQKEQLLLEFSNLGISMEINKLQ